MTKSASEHNSFFRLLAILGIGFLLFPVVWVCSRTGERLYSDSQSHAVMWEIRYGPFPIGTSLLYAPTEFVASNAQWEVSVPVTFRKPLQMSEIVAVKRTNRIEFVQFLRTDGNDVGYLVYNKATGDWNPRVGKDWINANGIVVEVHPEGDGVTLWADAFFWKRRHLLYQLAYPVSHEEMKLLNEGKPAGVEFVTFPWER